MPAQVCNFLNSFYTFGSLYLIPDDTSNSLFKYVSFELTIVCHLFFNPIRLYTMENQVKWSPFYQLFPLLMGKTWSCNLKQKKESIFSTFQYCQLYFLEIWTNNDWLVVNRSFILVEGNKITAKYDFWPTYTCVYQFNCTQLASNINYIYIILLEIQEFRVLVLGLAS